MEEMSAEWAHYRLSPGGEAVFVQARANFAIRSRLKAKIKELLDLKERRATEVADSVVASEFGFGDKRRLVLEKPFRHLAKCAPVAEWEQKWEEFHTIVPAQPKSDFSIKQTLECAGVGFCLSDAADEGLDQPMRLFADSLSTLFHGNCVFAKSHAIQIANASVTMCALFFKRHDRIDILAFKLSIGDPSDQLFLQLCHGLRSFRSSIGQRVLPQTLGCLVDAPRPNFKVDVVATTQRYPGDIRGWKRDGSPTLFGASYTEERIDGLQIPSFQLPHKLALTFCRKALATASDCIHICLADRLRKDWKLFDLQLHLAHPLLQFELIQPSAQRATVGLGKGRGFGSSKQIPELTEFASILALPLRNFCIAVPSI